MAKNEVVRDNIDYSNQKIIDVDSEVSAAAVEDIKKIDGVIKIRVIK